MILRFGDQTAEWLLSTFYIREKQMRRLYIIVQGEFKWFPTSQFNSVIELSIVFVLLSPETESSLLLFAQSHTSQMQAQRAVTNANSGDTVITRHQASFQTAPCTNSLASDKQCRTLENHVR